MTQNHFCWLPTVANGTPEQAAFFFSRFLAGDRIGYIHSGAVGRPRDSEHMVRRTSGGWLASGRRHYSPGVASAHWLAFTAPFQVADQRSVFVFFADAAAKGVTAADGEGETGRGMVIFDDVFVPDSSVFPLLPSDADGRLFQLNAGLIHAAIALGIAEDALSDAGVYVRDLDVPAACDTGQEHAEQPFVAGEFAKFDAAVRTAGVLVRDAARAVDQARAWPSTGTVLNARLAVADARLLCADVANKICDEFYLLADVCATLGRYGFERHRRDVLAHELHDPLQWWGCHPGVEYLNGWARPTNPDT
jgi:alkylation response protein AidB-like acyl-CoA dehydrogenase